MNTMELVHLVSERAPARSSDAARRAPLFYTELIGPARQAILRARQRLLSEQRDDGSWRGRQTTDASLASQLILLLAYQDNEQSELGQQALASILAQQLPNGGWSRDSSKTPDLNTSVLAYFALKLTGLDPSDERLARARRTIRDLGGADAADADTRLLLAILGQISFDHCETLRPESLLRTASPCPLRAAQSILWAYRPTRKITPDRGVRELFISQPADWPRVHAACGLARMLDWLADICERRGWLPRRARALDHLEASLLQSIESTHVEQRTFEELIWCSIAVEALGYAQESEPAQLCSRQLNALIEIDDTTDAALPQLRDSSFADTLTAILALRTSGTPQDHPSIARAEKWLARARRFRASGDYLELASVLRLLSTSEQVDFDVSGALPPELEIDSHSWHNSSRLTQRNRRLTMIEHVARAIVNQLVRTQNADGGWGPNSTPQATAVVLHAIAATTAHSHATTAIERAIEHLRSTQLADGSWPGEASDASVLATSQAICAMQAAGVSANDDAIAAALNWLAVHQHPAGGWREPAMEAAEQRRAPCLSPSVSAAVLAALVAVGDVDSRTARRAAQFLVETQQDDGGWDESDFVLHDVQSGRAYRSDLHAVASPLAALSQWAVAAADEQDPSSRPFDLRLVNQSVD